MGAGTGPPPPDPPSGAAPLAHELGGLERAGGRGSADVDAEGPEAQDLQRLGGEAASSKLDGSKVEDGEQAVIGGVAVERVQEKGSAAGSRL
mmetsp:Transcript_69623/g.157392  ORF Transcript_69623/g.157392 Transcript_69623/m.157392 type:complete len:92 (+) Transcript_69623:1151-1426(+)